MLSINELEKQLVMAYKSVFSTDAGKNVLDDLSLRCFENRSTYVENNHDKQNVNQGKRSIILYIRDILSKDLDKPEQKTEQVKDEKYI